MSFFALRQPVLSPQTAIAVALGLLSVLSPVAALAPIKGLPAAANALLANVTTPVKPSSKPEYLSKEYLQVCKAIKAALGSPNSEFYTPVNLFGIPEFQIDPRYADGIWHYATSGQQNSACVIAPATPEDISVVVKIAGATRLPFNIKSGGHSQNPGFSSTPGALIWMKKFNQADVNKGKKTANIGPGQVWDDVYARLEPQGVIVVGGRVSGVGVGGFSLGGGYSWFSGQHGLTSDSIVQYDLVLPTGELATATASKNPDLFFALKGGLNKFGVVYNMVMKTYPLGQVYAGFLTLANIADLVGNNLTQIGDAVAAWSLRNKDPKAVILPTFNYFSPLATYGIQILVFYDGPKAPKGTFDEIFALPALINGVATRKFTEFVALTPSHLTAGLRGYYQSVSLQDFTKPIMAQVVNQTRTYARLAKSHSSVIVSYDVEPFVRSYFDTAIVPSAYPHSKNAPVVPLNLYFSWAPDAQKEDAWYRQAITDSIGVIADTAKALGQDLGDSTTYPNYALPTTPLTEIYGSSLPRLRTIRKQMDPKNVMGLAGGFAL